MLLNSNYDFPASPKKISSQNLKDISSAASISADLVQHKGHERTGEARKFICPSPPSVTEVTYLYCEALIGNGNIFSKRRRPVKKQNKIMHSTIVRGRYSNDWRCF
jgi:hypothetical protein